jgi:hypothetical protein
MSERSWCRHRSLGNHGRRSTQRYFAASGRSGRLQVASPALFRSDQVGPQRRTQSSTSSTPCVWLCRVSLKLSGRATVTRARSAPQFGVGRSHRDAAFTTTPTGPAQICVHSFVPSGGSRWGSAAFGGQNRIVDLSQCTPSAPVDADYRLCPQHYAYSRPTGRSGTKFGSTGVAVEGPESVRKLP